MQDYTHEENLRVYEIGKNKLNVKRTDPYGFWHMSFERGELPEELQGTYTSFAECQKKIEIYLNKKKTNDSAPISH